MSVDVEIYMSNIIKFFKENPADLLNLVPKDKEQDFFIKIREESFKNFEKGEEASLTQPQLIKICAELNGKKDVYDRKIEEQQIKKVFVETKFGNYCLN
jgi:hypothetical protein